MSEDNVKTAVRFRPLHLQELEKRYDNDDFKIINNSILTENNVYNYDKVFDENTMQVRNF